jgi:hypothetical protein
MGIQTLEKIEEIEEIEQPVKVTVKQIHDEFDAECDRIVEEAMRIINPIKDQVVLADKLESLGFKNCRFVKEAKKLKYNKAVYEKARYYKEKYPFLKFITEDAFERICRKYGLKYAPAENYVSDIPEKNIDEIINRSDIDEKDVPERMFSVLSVLFDQRIEVPESDLSSAVISRTTTAPRLISDKTGLYIAADESQFNLNGLEETKDGFGYTPKVVDPIVFQYVKGDGILIITKWGEEANDPELKNEGE